MNGTRTHVKVLQEQRGETSLVIFSCKTFCKPRCVLRTTGGCLTKLLQRTHEEDSSSMKGKEIGFDTWCVTRCVPDEKICYTCRLQELTTSDLWELWFGGFAGGTGTAAKRRCIRCFDVLSNTCTVTFHRDSCTVHF